jgi:hypothetical protein
MGGVILDRGRPERGKDKTLAEVDENQMPSVS